MLPVPRRRGLCRESGSAVVDVVLVMAVLVPVVLGIVQVGLVLFVRNTLAAAASEGARYAAAADRGPVDGVARARSQLAGVLAARFADDVEARPDLVDGAPGVAVRIGATVPALGLCGPAVELSVTGRAVEEAP